MAARMSFPQRSRALTVAVFAAVATWAVPSHALFEDDEARRAILELRQRFDALQQSNQRSGERSGEEVSQLRRSLLDLQTQIEALRTEQASLRTTLADPQIYAQDNARALALHARDAEIEAALMLALERWEALSSQ